jgi:translation initiation factor IF-2
MARSGSSRNNTPIFAGEIGSLKREKDDVREVREGFECGIAMRQFHDFQVGDILGVAL